jgi:hypothetical protein
MAEIYKMGVVIESVFPNYSSAEAKYNAAHTWCNNRADGSYARVVISDIDGPSTLEVKGVFYMVITVTNIAGIGSVITSLKTALEGFPVGTSYKFEPVISGITE